MNSFKLVGKRYFCSVKGVDSSTFKTNILASVGALKNCNLKDYYLRRLEHDFAKGKFDNYTEEKLKETLSELNNLVSVQNLYFIGNNVIYSSDKI